MELLPDTYWEDYRWANAHMSELVRDYPNQWVGVAGKQVVAAGSDVKSVELEVKRKLHQEEFPILFVERGVHVYKG